MSPIRSRTPRSPTSPFDRSQFQDIDTSVLIESENPMYFLDIQSKEDSAAVYYIEDIKLEDLSFKFTVKRSLIFNRRDHLQKALTFYE